MPQIPQYTQQVEASTRGLPEPHASPTGIGTAIAGFGLATRADVASVERERMAEKSANSAVCQEDI